MITIEEALEAVYVAALGHSDDEVTHTAKQLAYVVLKESTCDLHGRVGQDRYDALRERIDKYG